VVLVSEDEIHYLGDGSSFVQGAIYIVDGDRPGQHPGGQASPFDIPAVYELASGSGVYKRVHTVYFPGIGGFDTNREVQGMAAAFIS
jgi:hypothetical protein